MLSSSSTCWHALSIATQEAVGRLCHNSTLLSQFLAYQDPKVLLCRAAFQPVLVHELILPLRQEFAFPFAEFHDVPLYSFLQIVKILLNGNTVLWCISHFSQFFIFCELAEGALHHIIHVIIQDFQQYWPQYQPLGK